MGAQGQLLQDSDGKIVQNPSGQMMTLDAAGECAECCGGGDGPGVCCDSPYLGYYDTFSGVHEQEVSASLSLTETTSGWKYNDGADLQTMPDLTTTVSLAMDATDGRADCAGIQTEQSVNRTSGGWVDPGTYLPSGGSATVTPTAASVSNSPSDVYQATPVTSFSGPVNYPGTGIFTASTTFYTSYQTGPGSYTYTQSGFSNTTVLFRCNVAGRGAYAYRDTIWETAPAGDFNLTVYVDAAGKCAAVLTSLVEPIYATATKSATASASLTKSGNAPTDCTVTFSFTITPPATNPDTGDDDMATISGSGTFTASTNMIGCTLARGAGCSDCGDGGEDPGVPE
ncbi:MAG: hypothetical protein KF805_12735 [Phycisphaeraceae bacterium]|nr:hypothetical protein [Phycisphaeraceae bacterium]